MSTRAHAVSDSATMLRRNLRHALRYPSMSVSIVAMPVIFLLLFVYVFGGTLGAGLGGAPGGGRYIDYVVPGIIVLTAATGSMSTAVSVCVDMTEGIVARFRTMAIFRPSLLTGHVAGSMIQAMLSMGLVISAALLMTSPMLSIAWIMLPATCPVSNEGRKIAIVRKRATIPSVMSTQTD